MTSFLNKIHTLGQVSNKNGEILSSKEYFEDDIDNFIIDGSIFGKMAEQLLIRKYPKLSLAPKQGYYDVYSVIQNTQYKFEVRTLTKNGCWLIPSNQIGSGRKYNELDYHIKIKNIHGYIIIDTSEYSNTKTLNISFVDTEIVLPIFGKSISTPTKIDILRSEGQRFDLIKNEKEKARIRQILHKRKSCVPTDIFSQY